MNTKQEVVKLLSKAAGLKENEVSEILEVPPNPELGDYAMPCFKLAAKLKKAPQIISKEIAEKIKPAKLIKKISVDGPYVNLFLNQCSIAEALIFNVLAKKDRFGSADISSEEQIVIDVIGLNPNKAGHIGHIKSGCVGDSLARVYKFSGFKTNTQSFINDQGLPTTLTFYAHKYLKNNLPKREGYLKKEDHWQGAVYTMMKKLAEEDTEIKKKVEELQYVLENNKNLKLVKEQREFIEGCKAAQAKTWVRLNIDFDLGVHESDLVTSGIVEKTYELLKKKNAVYISSEEKTKGCLMLRLSQFDAFKGMLGTDKILVRPDGRTTYTGKDLGLQFWRFNLVPDLMKYKVSSKHAGHIEWATNNLTGKKISHSFNKNSRCMHVVGAEQKYVISVDYYAMKAAGYEREFANCYHLASGLVGFGEEAKISSRKGTEGFSADEILDKLHELALQEVKKRNPKMAGKKANELAEKISVGAIKYYLLRTDPTKFVKFSFEDALSFEGNTGPYLQYALVRAKKILQKAGKAKGKASFSLLQQTAEIALVKKISAFPEIVEKAGKEYAPYLVAGYAFELANSFSSFYEACPVIAAESEGLRNMRLKLVQAFAQTLKNTLNLLGIDEVDVM